MWKQWQTIFLGSKITVDGDWSHKIKKHFLLGRKVMTNLDSILKAETSLCQQRSVWSNLWFFPVVMHRCESWTTKKTEHQKIDAFKLWCWRRLLRVPWTARRPNKSILREINPEYSLEGLMLKLQYFGHLMWRLTGKGPDDGKDWKQEKGATEETMVGWHHQINGHEFEQTPANSEGQGNLAGCSPQGHKGSDTT